MLVFKHKHFDYYFYIIPSKIKIACIILKIILFSCNIIYFVNKHSCSLHKLEGKKDKQQKIKIQSVFVFLFDMELSPPFDEYCRNISSQN